MSEELPQTAITAVTSKPSIQEIRRIDPINEVEAEMSMDELKDDSEMELDVSGTQNQELTTERDPLQQQPPEMSRREALRQSQDEIAIGIQEMSLQIEELTNQFQALQDSMHRFAEELRQMNQENSRRIRRPAWNARG